MSESTYDMDSVYHGEPAPTIASLIRQIEETLFEQMDVEKVDKIESDTIRSKLKNNDGTGIIDKLKNIDHFDIEKIAKKSPKEKFDMMKLVKKLYFIEKVGEKKYDAYILYHAMLL